MKKHIEPININTKNQEKAKKETKKINLISFYLYHFLKNH